MSSLQELMKLASRLPENRLGVLVDLAGALGRGTTVKVNPDSTLATTAFAEDFSGRLLAYHAFHEEKLTKKTFEFVFCRASRADGRHAQITGNSVKAGADVIVDEVAFSLKTEGSRSMNKSTMTISKLMEARWIRECLSVEAFAREVTARVTQHLNEYERILMLRAFDRPEFYEYDLVEIPLEVLRSIATLQAADFTPRTSNGSSSAYVSYRGQEAFNLRLDGSVEKVTISALRASLCIHHATWQVPRLFS